MRLRATLELSADALTPGGAGVSTLSRDAVLPQKTKKLQADANDVRPELLNAPNHWKTICMDFDGVLCESKGPYSRDHFGPPIKEGIRLLSILKKQGYNVVILTARKETDSVAGWLKRQGFPNLLVTNHKVPAVAYIDDRALSWDDDSKAEDILKAIPKLPSRH